MQPERPSAEERGARARGAQRDRSHAQLQRSEASMARTRPLPARGSRPSFGLPDLKSACALALAHDVPARRVFRFLTILPLFCDADRRNRAFMGR